MDVTREKDSEEPTLHMNRIQVGLGRIVSSADCTPCKIEEKMQRSHSLPGRYIAQLPSHWGEMDILNFFRCYHGGSG